MVERGRQIQLRVLLLQGQVAVEVVGMLERRMVAQREPEDREVVVQVQVLCQMVTEVMGLLI